jgi:hypothetical protein
MNNLLGLHTFLDWRSWTLHKGLLFEVEANTESALKLGFEPPERLSPGKIQPNVQRGCVRVLLPVCKMKMIRAAA